MEKNSHDMCSVILKDERRIDLCNLEVQFSLPEMSKEHFCYLLIVTVTQFLILDFLFLTPAV